MAMIAWCQRCFRSVCFFLCCCCFDGGGSECLNTLRLVLWWIRFRVLILWKIFLRCKSFDQALDEIAQQVAHKHPISKKSPKVRPETFHNVAAADEEGNKSNQQRKRRRRREWVKPVKVLYPSNVDDLIRTVRTFRRFRPIGSGHSWRHVVETGQDAVLISLASMNRLLHVDHANLQVTFEAGIILHDAIRVLHENYGLAFVNLPSYDRQTLGGALCSGTHGTSGASRIDTFTSSIVELKMVTAQGGDITLEPEESVTYGVGGIIYQVTLKVVPIYYLRQITTTIDPSLIDFDQWWDFDYGSFMARWSLPNYQNQPTNNESSEDDHAPSHPGICQLIQFEKASVQEYEEDRAVARRHRRNQIFFLGGLPIMPRWKLRRIVAAASSRPWSKLSSQLLHRYGSDDGSGDETAAATDSNFVDTYFRHYVDDPAPHHVAWEYAVPMVNNPNELVPRIPETVAHIPYPVQIDMRVSPQDKALGHLAHDNDVVWFNLAVVLPPGEHLTQEELDALAEPFERLMTSSHASEDGTTAPVLAHPHKLVVDQEHAGLTKTQADFLASFQYTHDPKGKMFNDALGEVLRGRKPKITSSLAVV